MIVDVVVKLGGSLLAHPGHLDSILAVVAAAARARRLVVVPGGGPFADTVREVDRQLTLSDHAAHWMAVLAMDQYAHVVTERVSRGVLVTAVAEIQAAAAAGCVPVLAPSRWLREADPLPHAWAVTSDSIAAWVAGELGASHLILVKPPGVARGDVVDAYLARALPADVRPILVPADHVAALEAALSSGASWTLS